MTTDEQALIEAIEEQRDLNAQTWLRFRDRGVTDATPLALDATFLTETAGDAAELALALQDQFGYTVSVLEPGDVFDDATEDDDDEDVEPFWSVIATTSAMSLTLDALDRWTDQMIDTSWKFGNVVFDGWGAMLPARVATLTEGTAGAYRMPLPG